MYTISIYQEPLHSICKTYSVKSLYVFGSILTPRFNSTSDVDLIVEFDSQDLKSYADNYYALKEALQKLFDRPIDLLENQSIRNSYFRKEIDSNKFLVYGQ